MINIYTDKKFAPSGINWVLDNDAFFSSHIIPSKLDDRDLDLLHKLGGLTVIDKENGLFSSPVGNVPLSCIPTGLTTLLNIRFLNKSNISNLGVDISYCDRNVLEHVFEEVKDGKVAVLLRHNKVLSLSDRYMLVNGETKIRTMNRLYSFL